MSDDDKRPDVIDLASVRAEREQRAGQAAYEAGEVFKLCVLEDPAGCLGFVEGPHPIALMVGAEDLVGLAMTREAARELGRELLAMADAPDQSEGDTPAPESAEAVIRKILNDPPGDEPA